eukprot:TRINITY_DN6550_c0_g1_i1.p1 TRINITY_DN6550_c0_g1~~TRINITY_DN6550_c0_g1_i1.p1  ORF type:complete len:310 (-),score=83.37 TRINITY_DN6550_c0_g1_i1:115-1044(-)
MSVFLGVDGGGTKTHTVCIDNDGTIIGEAITGCSNWTSVGETTAMENLKQGIEEALAKAGKSKEQVSSITLGMAGIDRPSDRILLEKNVKTIINNDQLKLQMSNDAIVGLVSGTKKLHGVVVISGTGSIVLGVDDDNKTVRSGGWGPILGDEGSGFAIGHMLLKEVCQAEDNQESSLLKDMVLKELNLSSAWDLIDWTYKDEKFSSAKYAKLSPIVFNAAKQGDVKAKKILEESAQLLTSTIESVFKKSKFSGDKNLVFCGGNLTHDDGNGIYATLLKEKVKNSVPDVHILLPSISPGYAAALLAKDSK